MHQPRVIPAAASHVFCGCRRPSIRPRAASASCRVPEPPREPRFARYLNDALSISSTRAGRKQRQRTKLRRDAKRKMEGGCLIAESARCNRRPRPRGFVAAFPKTPRPPDPKIDQPGRLLFLDAGVAGLLIAFPVRCGADSLGSSRIPRTPQRPGGSRRQRGVSISLLLWPLWITRVKVQPGNGGSASIAARGGLVEGDHPRRQQGWRHGECE